VEEDIIYEKLVKDVGDKIRKHRIAAGYTMRAVADMVGMEENNYGRFEKGQSNATLKSLAKICSALDIEVKDLF